MPTRFRVIGLALILAGCGCAVAEPAAQPLLRPRFVLLIRHAEKPADPASLHLSPDGVKRAEALPSLFEKSAGRSKPFPTPDFIFAAKQSKRSNRSVETVTPLAKVLNRDIISRFANDDYLRLAAELFTNPKYADKVVLICWHHGNLPELAAALKAAHVPAKWPDRVFNQVWVVSYDEAGRGRPLVRVPQRLLPGDSAK